MQSECGGRGTESCWWRIWHKNEAVGWATGLSLAVRVSHLEVTENQCHLLCNSHDGYAYGRSVVDVVSAPGLTFGLGDEYRLSTSLMTMPYMVKSDRKHKKYYDKHTIEIEQLIRYDQEGCVFRRVHIRIYMCV